MKPKQKSVFNLLTRPVQFNTARYMDKTVPSSCTQAISICIQCCPQMPLLSKENPYIRRQDTFSTLNTLQQPLSYQLFRPQHKEDNVCP